MPLPMAMAMEIFVEKFFFSLLSRSSRGVLRPHMSHMIISKHMIICKCALRLRARWNLLAPPVANLLWVGPTQGAQRETASACGYPNLKEGLQGVVCTPRETACPPPQPEPQDAPTASFQQSRHSESSSGSCCVWQPSKSHHDTSLNLRSDLWPGLREE